MVFFAGNGLQEELFEIICAKSWLVLHFIMQINLQNCYSGWVLLEVRGRTEIRIFQADSQIRYPDVLSSRRYYNKSLFIRKLLKYGCQLELVLWNNSITLKAGTFASRNFRVFRVFCEKRESVKHFFAQTRKFFHAKSKKFSKTRKFSHAKTKKFSRRRNSTIWRCKNLFNGLSNWFRLVT